MTEAQKAHAKQWLEQRWQSHALHCEMCGADKWSIAEHLVSPPPFNQTGQFWFGAAYPSLMVICDNCGNTKMVNAHVAGILHKESEAKE